MCDGPTRVKNPSPPKPKRKKRRRRKQRRRTPEGSLLPPLVGSQSESEKSPPLALFKEENPPLSLPPKILSPVGGNRRKTTAEDRLVPIQLLAGKASPASEVSLLPFLSSPLSFPCLCVRSLATGVAGFCCGKKSLFYRFSLIFDIGGHRRPPVWPSSRRWVAPLLPTAALRWLHHRSASQ